ncbi:MAG: adenylate/guanylate cyclase domain-containing protein, partial [Actinomycetota bacterium]
MSEQSSVCPRCGAPVPPGARFCAQCGAPLDAATTEERRVVTVLFADLADSTELANTLDPERFREVIANFYGAVLSELESLRGRAEKFAGDAVMAVFGLPHSHDDDAVRAVHAATRIRERTARLAESQGVGVPLRVRVGINTGRVAAGAGPAGQFLVSGATVNLAARLQQAAEPGEILVGQTTRDLTAHAVRFAAPRTVMAKGFDEHVVAHSVEALSSRSTRRTLPLVGRRRELSLLLDAFQRAAETSRPHMVTVLGEAGIGKSRVVEEFIAAVPEGTRVMTGRVTEFEEDPTFSALAEMLRRELGLKRDAPREDVSKLLHEMVAGCCDPPEVDRVAARLGLVLGLGERSQSQQYEVAEIRSGLMALLQGLTATGPVTLIFEDLEIARPGLLDLIEQLVARAKRLPLLVVCVARDGLLEQRPVWGGGVADTLTIRLEALNGADGAELARAAGGELDDAQIDRVVGNAGGNPFFIVETTGMLMAERSDHAHGAPHSLRLPPTVQAVVASRIDHLPDPKRDLVRKASVFPRSTFNLAELALVTTADDELLAGLEDEELLVRDDKRPGVWRFRHELLRDVAYDSLPKRERMRLHLRVAEGLPEKDRYPSVVAYHLEQAAVSSLDLN